MSKSGGGYKALLQSLDEDVSRGLGRPVPLKSGRRRGRCCGCSRPWIVYACVTLVLATAVFLAIGIPMVLRLPASSPYHWTHWKQMFIPPPPPPSPSSPPSPLHPPTAPSSVSSSSLSSTRPPDAADAADAADDPQTPNAIHHSPNGAEDGSLGNHTEPLFYDPEDGASGASGASGTSGTHPEDQQTLNLIQKAVVQMRQVIRWSRERYDRLPKMYLIIGVATLSTLTLTFLALLVYRRLVRRQRRRTIGKLVTDLQSGDSTLLLDSDTDDD